MLPAPAGACSKACARAAAARARVARGIGLQGFEQQRQPGLRLAEDQRRARAAENLAAQRLALDRFAVGLHHRQASRHRVRRPRSAASGRGSTGPCTHSSWNRKIRCFGVGGVLAHLLLQRAERVGQLAFTDQLLADSWMLLAAGRRMRWTVADGAPPASSGTSCRGGSPCRRCRRYPRRSPSCAPGAVPSVSAACRRTSTLAKLSVTFSVRRSSPPLPPVETEVTITSSIVDRGCRFAGLRRPCAPAARPSGMCVPLASAIISALRGSCRCTW